MKGRIRVLVTKPGLDGHDRGVLVVARALRDAGMEVIYTGFHQTPKAIVKAAIQEDCDVIAVSILSGAHMTLLPRIKRLLDQQRIKGLLVTGGGIIPVDDQQRLSRQGIGRLFGPGTSTQEFIQYIKRWYRQERGG